MASIVVAAVRAPTYSAATSTGKAGVAVRATRRWPQVGARHIHSVDHRLHRCRVSAADDKKSAGGGGGEDEEELLPIERQLAKRKPQKKVKVVAPAVEEARGERPASPQSEFETNVLSVLSFLGLLVLLLGVLLAASGFLPEDIDNMISNTLYPAYSPFVGVFLLCSTAYGVWKSRQ
mmetsp:Transcript_11574/g.20921  ORF Transcript_11574/g.20921 Transcript_11574/m.20921 type:complete len:177 (-) Transcript_11574:140-670(-)